MPPTDSISPPPGGIEPPDGADDEFYARARRVLLEAVRRLHPAALANDREDIVQAALIRVMAVRARAEGNPGLSSSYMWKAAFTATVDRLRQLRRRNEYTFDQNLGIEPLTREPDPEATASAHELGRAIHEGLATLSVDRRRVVTAHLLGYTIPETARLLGLDAKRVENLAYRGVADLRRWLRAKGIDR